MRITWLERVIQAIILAPLYGIWLFIAVLAWVIPLGFIGVVVYTIVYRLNGGQ